MDVIYRDGKVFVTTTYEVAQTLRDDGYVQVSVLGVQVLLHRLVWEQANGTIPDGYVIDHINRNKQDNRLANLRLATRAENNCNSGLRSDNTSGVKGLSKRGILYVCNLKFGPEKRRASFYDVDEAKNWLTTNRAQMHGAFARS